MTTTMAAPAVALPPGAPPFADPGELDAIAWPYQSGRFRALGFEFGVRTSEPQLGRYLEDEVFRSLAAGGAPAAWYSLVDRGPSEQRRWEVYFGDERVVAARTTSRAVSMLLWHVNRSAVSHSPHFVLLHASAAERDGAAVVLTAPMESGKTTLVAGLVRAGLRYMTDETVAIDPATGLVRPYPRALSVDPGSWSVLADLEPSVDPGLRELLPRQWQVPPHRIRPDSVAELARPRLVITPRYDPNRATEAVPVSRAEMLVTMAENAFEFPLRARRNLEVLASVLGSCACYRMSVRDLGEGCRLVMRLLDEAVTRR